MAFGPCADYALTEADAQAFANETYQCARLEVPLDYEKPDGATCTL